MPGLDHEIHPSVRHGADARYDKCQGKERQPGYWALDRRYFPDGRFEVVNVWIEDLSSTDCRYDMSLTDSWCAGCKSQGSGEAYDAMIRARGT